MSQPRSNDAVFDGIELASDGIGSKSDPGLEAVDDKREAYDRARFPDNFYSGLILFLDRVRGRGVVRSQSGREIRFEFPFVAVVGAALGGRAPGIDLLHQGDRVGFDVGWTSRGLRITKIKPALRENGE